MELRAGRPLSNFEWVIAGVLYVLKEGGSWRALDVPGIAWETVYGHFRRWAKAGLWDEAMQQMNWHEGSHLSMIDSTHIKVHRDGDNPAGGQENQAMSRTKGGLNKKLHAAVDGNCQPQALILTAGTQADVVHAPKLLESVEAEHVLMDKAYDSDALRQLIESKGMKSCIPPRSNRIAPAEYDKEDVSHRYAIR